VAVKTIYKLTTAPEWEAAWAEGVFRGSAADLEDGFIHFSTAAQVAEVASRFYSGVADLVLLSVDIEMVENLHGADGAAALRFEAAGDGQLYPHLYGRLPATAVTSAMPLPLSDSGAPVVPLDLPS
jgi:uncharacterized protein (DUF952 family)